MNDQTNFLTIIFFCKRILRFLQTRMNLFRARVLNNIPKPPNFLNPADVGSGGTVGLGRIVTPEILLTAYRRGIFPDYHESLYPDDFFVWLSPDPRAVIHLDRLHIPRNYKRRIRQGRFEIRFNSAFEDVVRGCMRRENSWISDELSAAYTGLHNQGYAHCAEAWREGKLVGGVLIVIIGAVCFGESMFYLESDASSVAFVQLAERMKERGVELVDCQYMTKHFARFGSIEIPRSEFLERVTSGVRKEIFFT